MSAMNAKQQLSVASSGTEADRKRLTLSLGKNKLEFDNHGGWKVFSSDLDVAARQINALLDGKTVLENTISALRSEIVEANKLKTVALDMLTEERCKRVALEQQLEAHRQELRESCRVVLELRDQLLVANMSSGNNISAPSTTATTTAPVPGESELESS